MLLFLRKFDDVLMCKEKRALSDWECGESLLAAAWSRL